LHRNIVTPSLASHASHDRGTRRDLPPRRHDLDALRAAAMLLGIAYHAALSFSLGEGWLVQDPKQSRALYVFQAFVHGFRMQLFMLLSGFFTAMLWRRSGIKKLWLNRFRKVILPCFVGLFTVVPAINWAGAHAVRFQPPPHHKPKRQPRAETLTPALSSPESHASGPSGSVENGPSSPGDGLSREAWTDGPSPALTDDLRQVPASQYFQSGLTASSNRTVARANPLIFAPGPLPLSIYEHTTAAQILAGSLDAEHGSATTVRTLPNAQSNPGPQQLSPPDSTLPSGVRQSSHATALAQWVTPLGSWTAEWIGRPSESMFIHLWFLWFLVWLLPFFSLYAGAAQWLGWRIPPHAMLLSQRNMLWLLPLTLLPALRMNTGNSDFGPETSLGIFPKHCVLLYYGIFFGFGALYHECGDPMGRLGQSWRRALPFTLLVVFPVAIELPSGVLGIREKIALGECPRWVSVFLQTTYAWLMCFSVMGVFRSLLKREYQAVRHVCDASYWCYLTHLPVVLLMQGAVVEWNLPALIKFLIVLCGVCPVLALSYAILVRRGWIGTLLNGRP
jgi:fucose 4-O-acetylase-like acetyltransferase